MCTGVRFSDEEGNMYFGRNLDWSFSNDHPVKPSAATWIPIICHFVAYQSSRDESHKTPTSLFTDCVRHASFAMVERPSRLLLNIARC